jgi:hypothetical protein
MELRDIYEKIVNTFEKLEIRLLVEKLSDDDQAFAIKQLKDIFNQK